MLLCIYMTDHCHCICLASFICQLFFVWYNLILRFTIGEVFHPGSIVEGNGLLPAGVAGQDEKTGRQTYMKANSGTQW